MRLTTYADYSLRLLLYLAVAEEGLTTIPTIAASYGISQHHLVKVAHQLGVKGYITTVRGKNGGLKLARPAAEIRAGDVVRQMEPDMALVPCLEPVSAKCPILPGCLLRHAVEEAREAFLRCLDGYTLQDLCAPGKPLRDLLSIQPGPSRAHAPAPSSGKRSRQKSGKAAAPPMTHRP
jgi:Rrf2 family nitric oxide-sensitive transcriptional repressor